MRKLVAMPLAAACVALLLAAVPSQAAQLTSADFSVGFGATDSNRANSAWTNNETSPNNTATTIGDFSFSPALPTSNRFDGNGPTFPNRVLTDSGGGGTAAQTGADPSMGFSNGLTVPITASYNGAAPGDASGTPDFKLMVEITSISIYGGEHSASSTPATMAWEDVTSGHSQTSPAVALNDVSGGAARQVAANYTQLVWDPNDFETPLTGLNDSFTRTFGIVGRLVGGDLRVADGVEVEGKVHLIYNAVPEPSMVLLAGLGTVGLALCRRRLRR